MTRAPAPMASRSAEHYKNDVIGGQSPFVLLAKGRKDLARAILRKLILEIAGRPAAHQEVSNR